MRVQDVRRIMNNLPMTDKVVQKDKPAAKGSGLLARMSPQKPEAEDKKEDARIQVARYVREIQEERRKLKDGR